MALVVGLTGGIGSGKSAAADAFEKLGATVVDTDAISHELTGPGGAAIAEIRRQFGSAFIDASGAMDRKRMRDLVFSDPEEKQRLEALLHPMIRAESARRIAAAKGPYAVHVVPLLIESPDHRTRVISRALEESDRCLVPFQTKPPAMTSTWWVLPFHSRTRRVPGVRCEMLLLILAARRLPEL